MPKLHTFPTLYNKSLQIHISKLKAFCYLDTKQIKTGTINWSSNGNTTGSISIEINTHGEQPYIELHYKYNDEARKYKVYLTSTPSNLNRGKIWYFICPKTNKRCRILYSIDGYFLHREAFKGCMYEIQTKSKKCKQLYKILVVHFKRDYDLYEELYKKNFKKTYAGKPTKKYLRITKELKKVESILYDGIEQEMLN